MKFWDSSALVALMVNQSSTAQAEAWLGDDQDLVVWALSETEIVSALWRLCREGTVSETDALDVEAFARKLLRGAHRIVDFTRVHTHACRALHVHPLRAADALQLGAALAWADGNTDGKGFCCLDTKLGTAARKEGFNVL